MIPRYGWTLLLLVALSACSKANDKSTGLDAAGKHQAGWAQAVFGGAHPAAFIDDPASCAECHGKDYTGGISKVSCFNTQRSGINCHAGGPSGHPLAWADPDSHGAAAKGVAAGLTGIGRCRTCHGADYAGGTIAKRSCFNDANCHGAGVNAAHSRAPWRSNIGGRTHTSTDPSNATACAVCHSAGANSTR